MIYLDYNATTPLCDAAREAMLPYFSQHFGNPSSIHRAGRNARAAVDNARDKIAALVHAKPNEIIFTSGGTESCNLALLKAVESNESRAHHLRENRASRGASCGRAFGKPRKF
jgi:cysteine desulfurase